MNREKYQEALDSLKDTTCDRINDCKKCSLTSYCGHYQCIKTLQELIDQNKTLTLDECVKEWEEKGFVFSNYDTLLIFNSVAKDISIEIYTNHMEIIVWDYECNEIQSLDFDLVFLLSKTLKALEVKNG